MGKYVSNIDSLVKMLIAFLKTDNSLLELTGDINLENGTKILSLFDPEQAKLAFDSNGWGYYYLLLNDGRLLVIGGNNYGKFDTNTCKYKFNIYPNGSNLVASSVERMGIQLVQLCGNNMCVVEPRVIADFMDRKLNKPFIDLVTPISFEQLEKRSGVCNTEDNEKPVYMQFKLIEFISHGNGDSFHGKCSFNMRETGVDDLFDDDQFLFSEHNSVSTLWALIDDDDDAKLLTVVCYRDEQDTTQYNYKFHLSSDVDKYVVWAVSNNGSAYLDVFRDDPSSYCSDVPRCNILERMIKPTSIEQLIERAKGKYGK